MPSVKQSKTNIMEHLNKVILQGVVGTAKTTEISGRKLTRFSVATNSAYKNSEGYPIIETTWHYVVDWSGTDLKGGDAVRVEGRIKNNRFTSADGSERFSTEVYATSVEKSNEKLTIETLS